MDDAGCGCSTVDSSKEIFLDLLFISGMVRLISAPSVVVDFEFIDARIMRDSSEFTDLLLLLLLSEIPLE